MGKKYLSTLCGEGSFDEVKKRLQKNGDPNLADKVKHQSRRNRIFPTPLCFVASLAAGIHIPTSAYYYCNSLTLLLCFEQDGNTGLHFASREGHANIVGLLLNNQADVNVKNKVCWGLAEFKRVRTRYDKLRRVWFVGRKRLW